MIAREHVSSQQFQEKSEYHSWPLNKAHSEMCQDSMPKTRWTVPVGQNDLLHVVCHQEVIETTTLVPLQKRLLSSEVKHTMQFKKSVHFFHTFECYDA